MGMRPMGSDHLETLTVKVPTSAILTLALQAHEKNVTLNDYVVGLATDEAKRVIEEQTDGR